MRLQFGRQLPARSVPAALLAELDRRDSRVPFRRLPFDRLIEVPERRRIGRRVEQFRGALQTAGPSTPKAASIATIMAETDEA